MTAVATPQNSNSQRLKEAVDLLELFVNAGDLNLAGRQNHQVEAHNPALDDTISRLQRENKDLRRKQEEAKTRLDKVIVDIAHKLESEQHEQAN